MKYFYRVCVVLLIAVGIVFGFSYYYKEKKVNENIVLTTSLITTAKKNEPTTSAETVYYDDNGFRLFTYKNKGYIEYNNVKKEAGGFEWALSQKSIDFKYGDFDGDKQHELLVLYFSPSYEINNSLLALVINKRLNHYNKPMEIAKILFVLRKQRIVYFIRR